MLDFECFFCMLQYAANLNELSFFKMNRIELKWIDATIHTLITSNSINTGTTIINGIRSWFALTSSHHAIEQPASNRAKIDDVHLLWTLVNIYACMKWTNITFNEVVQDVINYNITVVHRTYNIHCWSTDLFSLSFGRKQIDTKQNDMQNDILIAIASTPPMSSSMCLWVCVVPSHLIGPSNRPINRAIAIVCTRIPYIYRQIPLSLTLFDHTSQVYKNIYIDIYIQMRQSKATLWSH